jgi:WD40 repeat protein
VLELSWPIDVKNPSALAIAPDGRVAVGGGLDGRVVIRSADEKAKPRLLFAHPGRILSLAFGPPDTGWLAAGGADRTVHLWDLKASGKGTLDQPVPPGDSPRVLHGHTGAVTGLAFSPDGERLASVGGELKLWSLPGGDEVLSWPTPGRGVLFGPGGRHLAVVTPTDTIHLWDSIPHRDTLVLREAGSALAFLPDGKQVALAGRDPGVDLWNLERLRPTARLPGQNSGYAPGHARTVCCLAASRDGRWLATGGDDGSLRLWDGSTRQVRHSLVGHGARLTGLDFSPDGALLASSSMDETVRVWDVATGRLLTTWTGHDERVLCVAFRPDGRAVASGGEDGKVYLWDPRTGKRLAEPLPHPEPVNAVRFQPGGGLLATAGEDPLIRLWDAGTGQLERTLAGHEDSVRDLAFRPDGQRLASAGWDHVVKVWDVSRASVVTTLRGHHVGLSAVAFSPDGKQLAAADESLQVQVWTVGE